MEYNLYNECASPETNSFLLLVLLLFSFLFVCLSLCVYSVYVYYISFVLFVLCLWVGGHCSHPHLQQGSHRCCCQCYVSVQHSSQNDHCQVGLQPAKLHCGAARCAVRGWEREGRLTYRPSLIAELSRTKSLLVK